MINLKNKKKYNTSSKVNISDLTPRSKVIELN